MESQDMLIGVNQKGKHKIKLLCIINFIILLNNFRFGIFWIQLTYNVFSFSEYIWSCFFMFSSPNIRDSLLKFSSWISLINFSFEYLSQHEENKDTPLFMSELMFKFSIVFSLVMPIINIHKDLSKSSEEYSCLRSSFIASYTLIKGALLNLVFIILFIFSFI